MRRDSKFLLPCGLPFGTQSTQLMALIYPKPLSGNMPMRRLVRGFTRLDLAQSGMVEWFQVEATHDPRNWPLDP